MLTFHNKLPNAKVPLTFDLTAQLPSGTTLASIVSITVTALNGLDTNPTAILNGSPQIVGNTVVQPVQGGVWGERYQFDVLVNTSNVKLVLELYAVLPVGFAAAPVCYNDANFRAQFPAYASLTAYPAAALQFAWNMGANWMSQCPAKWGVGAYNPAKLQQAADLMGAVMVYQLYGPVTATSNGGQSYAQEGEAPGAVIAASEGSVSAQFQVPEIGTSAFSSMLLASPPYGRMLLALLQVEASVGPYIRSHRFACIPP